VWEAPLQSIHSSIQVSAMKACTVNLCLSEKGTGHKANTVMQALQLFWLMKMHVLMSQSEESDTLFMIEMPMP